MNCNIWNGLKILELMNNIAIKVENLSKIYRLGEIGTGSIGQDVDRWFKIKILGKEDPFLKIGESNDRANKGMSDIVYSLQDINFEINQGDAVGIIGRNGAGKSTLLKILSRVTTPTTGRINIKGRVASLLEVGTGFHPELTGRENIYLNGAILGMRKREIDRKLDEIIDFSGVERYIDTPVKRYSSGMYVRLAFAVAAHLESEILIVDEVLAVGDAEFQNKCLGKMSEVSRGEGRTVLFVSHNMGSIAGLCKTSILLENGDIRAFDNTQDIIKLYLGVSKSNSSVYQGAVKSNKLVWFKKIHLQTEKGEVVSRYNCNEKIIIKFLLNYQTLLTKSFKLFCIILDVNKIRIFSSESDYLTENEISLEIPPHTLVRGDYSIHAFIHKPQVEQIDIAEDVCVFSVYDDSSQFVIHGDYNYGSVFVKSKWY
jgi:lipopolysaccharide transport system ATP-binding protein